MIRHFPYMFAFDADPLTNGLSYPRIGIRTLTGDDFILRRVSGLSTVLASTGSYQLIRPVDLPLSQSPIRRQNFVPIIPQVYYPAPDHGIALSLNNVSKAVNTNVVASQLQFQGVLARQSYTDYADDKFYTATWTYAIPLTLSWANNTGGVLNPVRQFNLQINDYPFEWLNFIVLNANGTPLTTDLFEISFRDATDNNMMSDTVLQRAVNSMGGWYAQWPTLPVLYPVDGGLTYFIRSMVDPTDPGLPYTFTLVFQGQRRVRTKAEAQMLRAMYIRDLPGLPGSADIPGAV